MRRTLALGLAVVALAGAACGGGGGKKNDSASDDSTDTTADCSAALTTYADIGDTVTALKGAKTASAQEALSAIGGLKPPAKTGLEAFARINYGAARSSRSLLAKLADEKGGDCLVDPSMVDALSTVAPRRDGDAVILGTYADGPENCKIGHGYVAFDIIEYSCVSTTTATTYGNAAPTFLLDTKTGTVYPFGWTTRPGSDDEDIDPTIVAGRALYWATAVTPATGLQKATSKSTLYSAALDGTSPKPLASFNGGEQAQASILDADRARVMTYEYDGASGGYVLRSAVDGSEIKRWNASGSTTATFVAEGVDRIGSYTIDLRTAQEVDVPNTSTSSHGDNCKGAYFYGGGYGDRVADVVRRKPDGSLEIKPAHPANARDVVPVGDGYVVTSADTGTLEARDSSDAVKWRIDDDIFDSWVVFGGKAIITNKSKELVAVDSTTGAEGKLDPAIATVLNNSKPKKFDHSTGKIYLTTDTGGLELTIPDCKVSA